ncbi:hypothetical protein H6G97_31775 [Nostoc flagelliforme FACHB-838]|uniref:Mobilization protein MobC n=1 Tax=Nostoc flagelliforme FACHB-838 TaxID=2692904 RepID=A0ABR8DXK3_9NOSO|nr:hypothetical protein [Nostoc flagelliforme]MBD2533883.1 hypothetical protein [Nostoc flagelliforme FACHB-838]
MSEHQNSEVITKEKIDKAINLLKEQKPKEREAVSDRETIKKMRRYIEKLTSDKYGYSYDEVSEMLKGLGINLSGGRIKYLLGELKKSTHRRQKKNQGEIITAEVQSEPVDSASEVQDLPTNSRRGKKKNLSLANQQPPATSSPSATTETSA